MRYSGRFRCEQQHSNHRKRILLAIRNPRLVNVLARQLSRLGFRVWTITTANDGPGCWSPRLYDVVVFSADDTPAMLERVCHPAKKADPGLLLIRLADDPFGTACEIPDAIIAESDEAAIAEKLLALVNGAVLGAA